MKYEKVDPYRSEIVDGGILAALEQAGKKSWHARQVHDFMNKAEQDIPPTPVIPDEETRILRARLILEEALETINKGLGIKVRVWDSFVGESFDVDESTIELFKDGEPDLVELADGCADLRVVTTGTLLACGIHNDEELQRLVDESNLAKFEVPKCPMHQTSMIRNSASTAPEGQYICQVVDCGECLTGPYRRSDGKWIKPPDWKAPDIPAFLESLSDPSAEAIRWQDHPNA